MQLPSSQSFLIYNPCSLFLTMIKIPNYQISTQIYESANSLVYRGVRKKDNQPVILKVLKEDYPTPAELTRYRQEYEIIHDFDLAGVVKAYSIEKYQNTLVMILEDFGGESLKNLLNLPQPLFTKEGSVPPFEKGGLGGILLSNFIPLAIQITETLGQIHLANIIHKDINPANIVWHQANNQLKIIDFGIASRLPRENPVLKNPEQLEGTLVYISPEQTGRMNRALDYRTDLYSLGVTFYELLTGKLPFKSDSAMELVHCHIAKTPKPVSEINPDVPQIISDIVMKLMAKNVEDRYQSAFGVKFDLEKCREKLTDGENLPGLNFELAQNDFSGKLQIPQKLYGRDNEVNTLLQAFERVSSGKAEMMLIAGYSGVGKTALVNEVHKPMTSRNGYFASGKFDQFQKNIPYSAISQAFNKFCRYLLMESTETLSFWQTKILTAVGNNGQVIIDVIPDLELVIGSQSAVPKVGPTEAQNRFQMFFLNFIKALCDKDHPFILFIDDLQWVDSASLNLLKSILLDDEIKHLFIIGAYRDNEVDNTHPFMLVVKELQKANTIINTIELSNLLGDDVNQLLQDTLLSESALTQPLTNLINQKTQGNAFFTHQFLQTLYQEALLQFDFEQHQWQWNVEKIAAQNITANVVELMANKIDKLPSKTSRVLQLAACIGNQFDLSILAIINEQNQDETLSVLWEAIKEGLIQPLDENYKRLDVDKKSQFKFLHDRIQQAAYALIDEEQKQAVHLQIGRLLLKNTPADALEDKVFDIVGQFNSSLELLKNQVERLEIAKLNLMAGKKASMATAYEAASQYLNVGIELLPENSWQNQYELSFELYKHSAECEYLLTQVEQSEKLFSIALNHAQTPLEKAEIYAMQILHSMALSKLDEAISRARQGLRLCGMDFPADEQMLSAIQTESQQLANLIANKSISSLIDAPQMTDPVKIVAMRIFPNLTAGGYLSGNHNLFILSILMNTNLSVAHGQLDLSAYIYAWYGVLLSSQGRLQESYEFAQLSLKLSDKYSKGREKSQTHNLVGTFLIHLNQHLKHSIPVLMKGYHTGFEVGDVISGIYCFFNIGVQMFAGGETLPEVLAHQEKVLNLAYKNKIFNCGDVSFGYQQLIQFLMTGEAQYALTDELFDKEQLQRIKLSNSISFIRHLQLQKAFWFGDYTAAREIAEQAESTLAFIPGYILGFEHYFLYPLILTALYADASESEQEKYLQKIELCEQKMKIWAKNSPDNFLHRYLLIQAEKARITGQEIEAMRLYDQAIQLAKEAEFVQNAALGNQLAAKFWLDNGKEEFSHIYIKEAHYLYNQWGASAIVTHLETKYPHWFVSPKYQTLSVTTTNVTMKQALTQHRPLHLDLESVMKASQTLSGEIVLSKLLANLMHIVIENAGAEKGLLLLPQKNQWFLEAEGHVENEEVLVLQSQALEDCTQLPINLINYVARTQENVVLSDATVDGNFTQEAYIVKQQPKSILGMPLLNQGKLTGILYLENSLTEGAFTEQRLQVLNLLSSQVAISIENALLYNNLEQKVAERTEELAERTRELEQEVVERQRAEEAAKVASQAKTDFLSNMSHELRTPLNGILGYAQILKRGTNLEESQLSGLNTIYQSGNHLLTLINDILDLSKIEARKLELYPDTLHFGSFIESLTGIIHMRAEQKDIYFSYEAVGHLPAGIKADEKRLRQVLINLLGNAIKFTDQGQVTLRVSMVNEIADNQALIRFEVEDSGVGMTPEQLDKIFLPFEQVGDTKRRSAGTGLGLAISRQLVELMGGEILVESESSQGSRFWFEIRLPVVDVSGKAKQKTQQIIGYQGERRSILIVDDNQQNREILGNMLKLLDFNVLEACNGSEGVSLAKEKQPAMIFMDLVMPVMTGFEAVQILRQISEFNNTPIIANSASVFEADQEKSIIAGCNAFLPKPIEEDKLSLVLVKHLKLQWIYKEIALETEENQPGKSTSIVAPPPPELEALYKLAMMGNMRKIKEQATLLKVSDIKYQPFSDKLYKLAKEFKGKQILAFIKEFKKDS
jgi:predicted ATPase/signal transduction histidine kinase/DNA-binding NarL/FixJ family response regulator